MVEGNGRRKRGRRIEERSVGFRFRGRAGLLRSGGGGVERGRVGLRNGCALASGLRAPDGGNEGATGGGDGGAGVEWGLLRSEASASGSGAETGGGMGGGGGDWGLLRSGASASGSG
jgi:hypothetical protein